MKFLNVRSPSELLWQNGDLNLGFQDPGLNYSLLHHTGLCGVAAVEQNKAIGPSPVESSLKGQKCPEIGLSPPSPCLTETKV